MQLSVITDVQGLTLNEDEKIWLQSPYLGGIILFARNFSDVAQLEALVAQIRAINPHLLIGADHEGGRVQRFRTGFTRLPAMGRLGVIHERDPELAEKLSYHLGELVALELGAAGLDMAYSPVLDINYSRNTVIGDRAFGVTPEQVIALAKAFIEGLRAQGMEAVGKHFPGHGWVSADSHVSLPVDERSFEAINTADIQPFAALAQVVQWMMPAHVIYAQCDALTAGTSDFWLRQVLREQLGFKGLIVSDDLSMEGAASAGDVATRAELAAAAGCDVLLICNHPQSSRELLDYVAAHAQPLNLQIHRHKQAPVGLVAMQASEPWQKLVDVLKEHELL